MYPYESFLNADQVMLVLILMFCTLVGLLLMMAMGPDRWR